MHKINAGNKNLKRSERLYLLFEKFLPDFFMLLKGDCSPVVRDRGEMGCVHARCQALAGMKRAGNLSDFNESRPTIAQMEGESEITLGGAQWPSLQYVLNVKSKT